MNATTRIFGKRAFSLVLCGVGALLIGPVLASAAPEAEAQKYEQMVSKAINYLQTQGQKDDGSYSSAGEPGVTALVTTAILRHGRSPDDPLAAKSLKYLESMVRDDGGIYAEGSTHRNYETSLSIMAFAAANRDGRYTEIIERAEGFLKGIQWDQEEGKDESDVAYGGAGYGSHKRPDLSNTSFLIDALKEAGADADDEAMQRALVFVSRCQNLETEHNTTEFASKNPDGGFYYTPAAGGTSQAGETPQGGLRSYGSMTYAGLKSMIFAGVDADDPRVQAAYEWIRNHYTLAENPGMGNAGLYYYYHTFAKALDAIGDEALLGEGGDEVLEDDEGREHPWRSELINELAKRQRDDGAWVNENSRWLEGDPNLVTGYALLALSYCRPE